MSQLWGRLNGPVGERNCDILTGRGSGQPFKPTCLLTVRRLIQQRKDYGPNLYTVLDLFNSYSLL